MPVSHGPTRITGIRHAGTNITEVRHGSVLVWRASLLRDTFDDDRGIGLGLNWTDMGPSLTPYLASVENESYARINLPDGEAVIASKTSRFKWNAGVATTDDGYIETRVATQGDWDGTFETIFWSHMSDTGWTNGVGISLRGSTVRIVSLVGATKVDRANGGSFKRGDILRLVHSNGGTLHSLWKNGLLVAQWNDSTAIVSKGGGFRSFGLQFFGRKDFFLTPRRYSPGLDYVEAGGGDPRIRPMSVAGFRLFNSKRTPVFTFPSYAPAANDLLLVGVATTEFVAGGHVDPAGWTTPAGGEVASDANTGRLVYHLVTQAEQDSGQVTWSIPNYLNNAQNSLWGTAVAFRGVDPANPIDALVSTFNSANNATPHTFPAINGALLNNRSLVVGFICNDQGGTYGDPPADWVTLSRGAGQIMCARNTLTQVGVNVLAANVSTSFPDEFVGFSIALNEAPSS